MILGDMIAGCRLHLREPTRFSPTDWRFFLNTAQMEMQQQTRILEGDFDVPLVVSRRVYDLRTAGVYHLKATAKLGTTALPVKNLRDVVEQDLYAEGTPTTLYWAATGRLGVLPVPDAASDGQVLRLHGWYWPTEISSTTPDSFEPDFEPIDHPSMVLGAVLIAERVDTDLNVSQMIRQQYGDAIQSMRSRAQNRVTGARVIPPHYSR
jgi:hypothetical protein